MSDHKVNIIFRPIDCELPPAVEKMLDDIKEAKKSCDGLLGIPESRQGYVKHFEPKYTVDKNEAMRKLYKAQLDGQFQFHTTEKHNYGK